MTIEFVPFQDQYIEETGALLAARHRRDRFMIYRLVQRIDARIAWANPSAMQPAP